MGLEPPSLFNSENLAGVLFQFLQTIFLFLWLSICLKGKKRREKGEELNDFQRQVCLLNVVQWHLRDVLNSYFSLRSFIICYNVTVEENFVLTDFETKFRHHEFFCLVFY